MKYSAGIIPFRVDENNELEFFLGHPGGTTWEANEYWAYLKGGVEDGETWAITALREFKEESGLSLEGITEEDLIPLGSSLQNQCKTAVAFALYYPDIDPDKCISNFAEDGKTREVDKYRWMNMEKVKGVTHPAHFMFYEQIADMVKNGEDGE